MGLIGHLVVLFWRVLLRRLTRGRRHPSWSLPYEIGAELCGAGFSENLDLPSTAGGQRAGEPATPISPAVRGKLDFARGTLAGLPTEIHTPKRQATDGRTLLYLHGGGYIVCSPATHRGLIARMAAAAGVVAVAVDYRKAPEHPFPAGIDDCLAAYHALIEEGVDPAKLVIAGDSAGGGLVLAVLQRLREDGATLPAAAVLLSPWVDLTAESGSVVENDRYDYLQAKLLPAFRGAYLGDADPKSPLASPIFADLSGLPPMYVLTGTAENFYDQNMAFVEKAKAAGVDVTHELGPDQVHVYPLLADVSPFAAAAFGRMAEFMRAHT